MAVVVQNTVTRLTHDDRGIRSIGQPRNVDGIKYSVDPAKLHVDPESLPSQRFTALSQSYGHRGILESNICIILRLGLEALGRFHALGGDTCLRGKSVCQRCHHQMSFTETSPKLNSTGSKGVKKQSELEANGQLLFDGGVDIGGAFWENGYNECWRGLCPPLGLITRSMELL